MNGSDPQPTAPHETPPRPAGQGGCFLRGCLTLIVIVMLLGVAFGGMCWYLWHNAQPFLTAEPAIHRFQGGEAAYAATAQKLAAFNQSLAAGQRATVSLTADDLNALLAHDPRLAKYRDHWYLSIENNQIVAETWFPFVDGGGLRPEQRLFFNARLILDASYSTGDVAFQLARLETLDRHLPPPPVRSIAKGYFRNLSRSFNDDYHEHPEQYADLQGLTSQLHTIILQNNEVVATSVEHPKPVAAPAEPR